jgi:LmbE family N-acetylglucosaminyl deacetylase
MRALRFPADTPPKRVLCLGAHCDDIEIGCGATVLALVAACPGLVVDWMVFSGTPDRAAEARAAAAGFLAGAGDSRVVIHDFRDSYFPAELARLKDCLNSIAAGPAPDLVLTHHRHDLHQDHRTIGELTWQAFRNRLIWEYEIPKFDGDLGQPNLFVPVTAGQAARKVELILSTFRSQAGKAWFSADTFEALLRLRGIEAGSPTGRAEAFHAPKTVVGF